MGSCNVWCCPVFTDGWTMVFQATLQDTTQRLEVHIHKTKCLESKLVECY